MITSGGIRFSVGDAVFFAGVGAVWPVPDALNPQQRPVFSEHYSRFHGAPNDRLYSGIIIPMRPSKQRRLAGMAAPWGWPVGRDNFGAVF